MAETFYSVLGVDPEADTETIQAAYRELVKTHHPDVSDAEDAVDQFKRITQAREVLVDDASRKQYDRVGHNTYVRRYMDGNAWTVDHTGGTGTANAGRSRNATTGNAADADRSRARSDTSGERGRQSGGSTASGSRRNSRQSRRTGASETAHNYDRYRSEYSTDDGHGSRQYSDDWRDRSWTEDFDWDPDGDTTASADPGGTGTDDGARADGWQNARATASGYRPSGHDATGPMTGGPSNVGSVKLALRNIGPWLIFHFVFLMSAFVTILLLIRWEASVPTVFVSLVLLGGAVFFSVLHMVSRIYS
ncbi:J domain-containing protein [Halorientalis salina]|uniref:J domain-containing protein n=1 Tax=Halorientalis salina TaxID=2932266 RepID=UPI0010AC1E96|nr:DnaJ domain-containing protein [Halorientalis salina]